jgi:hypothetical protein
MALKHKPMQQRYYSVLALVLAGSASFAQTVLSAEAYDALKAQGLLPGGPIAILSPGSGDLPAAPWVPQRGSGGPCGCWIEPDGNYSLAMEPNDDLSTDTIALPFTFNLFGNAYDTLWINNNGNVSFNGPWWTYTAAGFPDSNYAMVAPFWGDVDTRDTTFFDADTTNDVPNGSVLFRLTDHALYVNWVEVGYFSRHGDKRNSFQLIITDGTDPVIPDGNNVSFCYKDMQWTTGDASQGVNGFGGVAATVGVNKGDGLDHAQVGRFAIDDDSYLGPYTESSGISWLDSTHFYLNTTGANLPPIFGSTFNCDTVIVQMTGGGDRQMGAGRKLYVLPGGPDQQVVCVSDAPSLPNFAPVNAGPDGFLEIPFVIETSEAEIGLHTITFTAYNPETPTLTSTYTLGVQVLAATMGGGDTADGPFTLAVRPNPANDQLTITIPAGAERGAVELVNADGRVIKTWSSGTFGGGRTVDVQDVAEGTYVIRLRTADRLISARFVKLAD